MLRHHINYLCCALTLLATFGFSSCKTPKDIIYFQDVQSQTTIPVTSKQIVIKPLDQLSIIVNTRDPQVTDLLNLPYVTRQLGSPEGSKYGQGVTTYNVSAEGNIDFPFLGELHVAGLNRTEAAALIKSQRIAGDIAKEPIVTVTFVNAQVAVLGEVARPGRYDIDSDDMTILDVIGAAGDLTIYGQREHIKVIRKNGDKEDTYIVNLLSADQLAQSPAYYVQQDDLLYVEPNPTRMRQSTVNGNTVLSSSFWISIASVAITLAALLIR